MVVVTGIVVGSAVMVGGTDGIVVGIVAVGVGVPIFTVQPAMQTAARISTVPIKRDFFRIIVVTAYFFIQIIVMDSPGAGKKVPEKRIIK
jgi:hypothetical protein